MGEFPEIDYDLLQFYEREDQGEGAKELACVGGACEIDWTKSERVNPEQNKFGLNE